MVLAVCSIPLQSSSAVPKCCQFWCFCHRQHYEPSFCPPLGFVEEEISVELHSGSRKHHQPANVNQTIAHYLTSHWMYFHSYLAVFLQYGSLNSLWVNYQVSQAPTPAHRPHGTKNIKLQVQKSGLVPLGLAAQLSVLPEAQWICRITASVKKLGERWLVRNQYLRMVHDPKSLGSTSVISKLWTCVQACLVYSYFYQQHENHLSNKTRASLVPSLQKIHMKKWLFV